MKTRRKRRILAMISSRHGIRDLPYKFPKQIYYSKLPKQQRKEGIEHVSKCENEEW